MSRSSAVSIENNFSRGLITEATAMNYPENSVVEADNCVFAKSGKVIRRYGIDFEDSAVTHTYEDMGIMAGALSPEDYYESVAIQEFEWTTVNNDGNIVFQVVQIGDRLNFFRVGTENNISTTRKSFSINIGDYQVSEGYDDEGQYVAELTCSFASGFGYLFVTHPRCNPFYVSYNATTDTITSAVITIKIRDFERLNDALDVDARPSTLSNVHKYNLYNQGWYISAKHTTGTGNVTTYWDAQRSDFPSNADIWWAYKNSSETLDASLFDTSAFGNTPAPNGHYTYSAFAITRNATLGVSDLTDVSTNLRPSVCAFYAGRVWYAGTPATTFTSRIYFSKIVEGVTDFGTCHQVNDPTSEDNSDLLETDGGVINIPDIAQVFRIVPVASSILIFASNGTWKISGPNGSFAANDYSVQKISSASIRAPNSVVIAEGLPFWWDKAGIYNITFDPTSNQETITNISETTIQTLINEIPDDNLAYVKGVYNSINKTIHWAYKDEAATTVASNYNYDKLLVLNLTTQSFSPQTISSDTPKVSGLTFTSISNNDPLLPEEGASLVKFTTIGRFGNGDRNAFTISQFNRDSYLDWETYNLAGTSFLSYFITGYRVRGELLKKFQSNYIVVTMRQEDDASALIQGVWDYSNSSQTGHFTSSQQAFKDNGERDYSRRKLKMRGNGYSLQFKFYSQTGKPFTIVGWSVAESGNATA
jgi:hypothetical protein